MARRGKGRTQELFGQVIARRLNGLFFLVVVLLTVLLFRLAQMQLIDKAFYVDKLNKTQTYTVKTAHPRGQIFDATGRPLAQNAIREVVAFTRTNTQTAQELKALARSLGNLVTLTESKVTRREKVDYYLADAAVYSQLVEALPDEQRYDKFGNRLKESEVYQHAVEAVTDDQIAFSEEELKLVYLFSRMNATPAFDTVSLKTGELSAEQIALLSGTTGDLAGLSVRADWERHPLSTSLSPLLGQVSNQETGLPAEEAEHYLELGYSLNDRVGTSYLEKYYEPYLQGVKTHRTITLDKDNQVVSDEISQQGEQGKNLKLTLDLTFQEGVERILEDRFREHLNQGKAAYSEGMYAVALNPQTGAVLAMAGLEHDTVTGVLEKDALGTMTKVFTPGSVVKGATIASGWENGVISGNQVLLDQPIQLAASKPILSWFTSSVGSMPLTVEQALEYSSNTYVVQIAFKLMGVDYVPGMLLPTNYEQAMDKLRATFAQFGMGAPTGIDLTGESVGYVPEDYAPANVLTESFGQFDNYTPLQLAQYVSTVANGGRRIAPHLVEGIYTSSDPAQLGELEETIEPKVMNTVSLSEEELELIQSGFYQVVHGNGPFTTGGELSREASTLISAKTGTAETFVTTPDGQTVQTYNFNVIAYAPSPSPQIAVAVVFPHSTDTNSLVSLRATRDIINLYQSMYPMN